MTASSPLEAEVSHRALALRIFRSYLAPRWRGLAVSIFCAVLVALLSAVLVWMLNPVVKKIFEQKRLDSLILICSVIVVAGVVRGVAQVCQAHLTNRIGHRMVGDIQVQLFGRLLHADLARLRTAHSGGYVASVLYDAGLIREAATAGLVNYTQQALTVVGGVIVMFTQDTWLACIVLVIAPILSTVMRRFSQRTRQAATGAMAETSALSTAIMESLDGIKVVKIDNREVFEEARVAAVIERRQGHIIKGANIRASAAPVTETLMTVITAAVIAYAGWRHMTGSYTLGQLFAFLASLAMVSQSLRQVTNLQTVITEGLTAAARLFAALDVAPEISDTAAARPLALAHASLRFEDVSFHYSPETPALSAVNLEVHRGETVALVGPSGGGKSTILNLIPRFYDATAGRVTLDGIDVRDVTLSSLRDHIALVTQEPFLFDDTIRANIAYGRPEASSAEVEHAAREAAAHDFISALPNGYDTVVGEAGARLSGGQRQRIAIARAFLKNAPILLLDEATSALDTDSEAKVQQALERLMQGRTTILIAHRLSTVRGADRIYVVDGGRIVEVGDHGGLISQQGLYARLARAQNLDVITPDVALAAPSRVAS